MMYEISNKLNACVDDALKVRLTPLPKQFGAQNVNDLEVYMFQQTWGSTALGLPGSGIGGQALVSAYTVVVIGLSGDAAVYFDGNFAYRVEKPNETFYKDLSEHNMVEFHKRMKYNKVPKDA